MVSERRHYDTKTSIRHVHLTLDDTVESTCSFREAFGEERTRASTLALHVQQSRRKAVEAWKGLTRDRERALW